MPPALIMQEAPEDQLHFHPLWLERLIRHLMVAAVSTYKLVLLLGHSTVIVATLGTPYMHYKLYRYDEDNGNNSSVKYSQMIQALGTYWEQHSDILLHILPALFPMVSSSGLPPCSTASIATTITFKVRVKSLPNEHAVKEWLRASKSSWIAVPNKSFWILFSLPSVTFLSIGLFLYTVVLTVLERSVVGTAPNLEMQGCSMQKWEAFKFTLFATLAATVAHFAFIFIKFCSYMTAS